MQAPFAKDKLLIIEQSLRNGEVLRSRRNEVQLYRGNPCILLGSLAFSESGIKEVYGLACPLKVYRTKVHISGLQISRHSVLLCCWKEKSCLRLSSSLVTILFCLWPNEPDAFFLSGTYRSERFPKSVLYRYIWHTGTRASSLAMLCLQPNKQLFLHFVFV